MRASAIGKLLVVTLAVMLGTTSSAARAQEDTPAKTATVVDLINHARVTAGLLPLARSPELDAAAEAHSLDMVQHDYLDHTGSDGSEPQDRADKAGYHVPPNSGWLVVEAISAISGEPSGPVNWWLSDGQHRRVLLNPRWREMGIGYAQGGQYGNYWTADFGCRPGVLPTVTLDDVSYTHTEQCGDPSVGAALAPTPSPQPSASAAPATLTPLPAPTLTPSPPAPSAAPPLISADQRGGSVTVTWSAIARPTATDWFGLYRPQDADSAFQDWAYVSCSRSPDQARASGSCSLPLPSGIGVYDVRLFASNSYTRLARSATVTGATAAQTEIQLSATPTGLRRGDVVNVEWHGIPSPRTTDWVGMYRPGDPDGAPTLWQYVGCSQTPLDARPLGSCNLLVPTALAPGGYELRLFVANSYQRIGVSPPIQVS